MKIRKLSTLLVCVILVMVMSVFSSCVLFGEKHTHTPVEHSAVAATCTENGRAAYWTCDGCDKIFANAECTEETTLDALVIPKISHSIKAVEEKAATCTENGYKAHFACEHCGATYSDAEGKNAIELKSIAIPKTNHPHIVEVAAGLDAEQKISWLYHWYCEDCDGYFADSFGDTVLSKNDVIYSVIPSVTINVSGKNAGVIAAISSGDVTLTSTYGDLSVNGTIADGVLTLTDVYSITYSVKCGNYAGTITFENGKTSYDLTLIYESYKTTGDKSDTVDLDHMGDEDPYIIIKNTTNKFGFAEFQGIGDLGTAYFMDVNVKINSTFSAWSDVICFVLTDGEGGGDMGLALWMSLDKNAIHITRYDPNHPEIIYDGKGNDATSPAMCSAITTGLYGDGLDIRVFRNGNEMSLLYKDADGKWVLFYTFATCSGNAKLALGAEGTSGESGGVVFSNIKYEKLTYHEMALPTASSNGYLEHFTDSKNNYYNMECIDTLYSALSISVAPTVEDSTDIDLTNNDKIFWMNPLYWEVYYPQDNVASIIAKANGTDIIDFKNMSSQALVEDPDDNGRGVMLNGVNKGHLNVSGLIGKYNDIEITVDKNTKRISVWMGAWLAKVRAYLYNGETLIGVAEFEASWNEGENPSVNKLVSFDIDTSSLSDGETDIYTLRLEYISSCASSSNGRVRLAGIAVFGEERKLTYHEEVSGEDYTLPHYTDAEGNYYTVDKELTTLESLKIKPTASEDAFDVNLTDSKANFWLNPLYWEVYTFDGAQKIQSMQNVDDLISFDFSKLTIYSDDGGQGVKLNGSSNSPFRIPGTDGAYSDITITAPKEAKRIFISTGTWLAKIRVSLYEGSRLYAFAEVGNTDWDPSSVNAFVIFDIDNDETTTYTLKIEYLGGVAGGGSGRVRLGAIALLGAERTLTHHDMSLSGDKLIATHYTDNEGNYYTIDKVHTTLEALTGKSCIDKAADSIDITTSGAKYWEYYDQDGTSGSVTGKDGANDIIDFDPSKQTLTSCWGENAYGTSLDGTGKVNQISIDGNGSFDDIKISVDENTGYVTVYVNSWLASVKVSLYDGENLISEEEVAGEWGCWKNAFTFAINAKESKTLTLRVSHTGGVAGEGDRRVHLSGIAVYDK